MKLTSGAIPRDGEPAPPGNCWPAGGVVRVAPNRNSATRPRLRNCAHDHPPPPRRSPPPRPAVGNGTRPIAARRVGRRPARKRGGRSTLERYSRYPGRASAAAGVVLLWRLEVRPFGGHASRQLTPAHTKRQPHRHCLTVFFTGVAASGRRRCSRRSSAWVHRVTWVTGRPRGAVGPPPAALLTTGRSRWPHWFRGVGLTAADLVVQPAPRPSSSPPALLPLAATAVSVTLDATIPRLDDPPFLHTHLCSPRGLWHLPLWLVARSAARGRDRLGACWHHRNVGAGDLGCSTTPTLAFCSRCCSRLDRDNWPVPRRVPPRARRRRGPGLVAGCRGHGAEHGTG